jgi:hypothetical protein
MTLPETQKQKIVLECIYEMKSSFLRAHNAFSTLINQTDMTFKPDKNNVRLLSLLNSSTSRPLKTGTVCRCESNGILTHIPFVHLDFIMGLQNIEASKHLPPTSTNNKLYELNLISTTKLIMKVKWRCIILIIPVYKSSPT